jgi:hypothetical protein
MCCSRCSGRRRRRHEKGEGKGDKKPITKEAYVANQQKMAEKKGVEADLAKIEARFEKLDKNKDGKLSKDEMPKKKDKKNKPNKADEE